MYPWRSPERIGDALLADQLWYFQRHRRPATRSSDFHTTSTGNPRDASEQWCRASRSPAHRKSLESTDRDQDSLQAALKSAEGLQSFFAMSLARVRSAFLRCAGWPRPGPPRAQSHHQRALQEGVARALRGQRPEGPLSDARFLDHLGISGVRTRLDELGRGLLARLRGRCKFHDRDDQSGLAGAIGAVGIWPPKSSSRSGLDALVPTTG